MSIALIFQIAEAAIRAAPGAIEAFRALKAAHDSGGEISAADLEKARAVVDALNAEIQAL